MIKVVKIKDPHQRWNLLSQFDPEKTNYLVSDIKTKLVVENNLIQKHGHLGGSSVLRIQEFFELLFDNIQSDWQMVSDQFLSQLFLDFANRHTQLWIKNLNQSKVFMSYLNQFLPCLFHPKNSELLEEWFNDEKQSSSLKWKHWYHLCQSFFQIMKEKKIIHQTGVKSFLMNQLSDEQAHHFLNEKLIVDLGGSLDSCDLSILKELSSTKQITLLVPDLEKKVFYEDSISSYINFLKEIPPSAIQNLDSSSLPNSKIFKKKNETQLDEVKAATIQIRKWLEEGIQEENIVLLSPNIESYWFSLQHHLKKENIKFKKSSVAYLSDFSSIKYWMSKINLHLNQIDFFNLETRFFYNQPRESFLDFYSKYYKIHNDRYLPKNGVQDEKKRNPNDSVSGREFMEWALSFLPAESESLLDFIFQIFLAFPLELELRWISWLKLLDSEISSKEKKLIEEPSQGISCLSFNAIDSIQGSHVFIMGLDEDSLQNSTLTNLTQKEREDLISHLGFDLPFSHPQEKEYLLLWFLQSSQLKEVILNFSSHQFSGKILTPSLFYILSTHLFQIKETNRDKQEWTSWDSRRFQNKIENVFEKLSQYSDIKKSLEDPSAFRPDEKLKKLSNSKLDLYGECPFKYMVKYLFHIQDPNMVDREISPLSLGNLVHHLFQELLSVGLAQLSEEKQKEIIENLKNKGRWIHDSQWQVIKQFLTRIAQDFLEEEKKRMENLPHIQPYKLEEKIDAHWDKKNSCLQSTGDYSFTGKIDRIDYDEKQGDHLLIDYKASLDKKNNIGNWISDKHDDLQLFLYVQAVSQGLIKDLKTKQVSALIYYDYKNFKIKGYINQNSDSKNFPNQQRLSKGSKGALQDEEYLSSRIKEANAKIGEYIDSIEEGHFFPIPKDEKTCNRCSWRKWCRASHLN